MQETWRRSGLARQLVRIIRFKKKKLKPEPSLALLSIQVEYWTNDSSKKYAIFVCGSSLGIAQCDAAHHILKE